MTHKTCKNVRLPIWICLLMTLTMQASFAQGKSTYMRMAKITVDSVHLSDYLVALKTQMQSALKVEKGVLAYSAVQDKNNLNRITILETYASVAAYQAHIQTEHFKKYKATVTNMVKELELTDVMPIAVQSKQR
jgi:quinol monooxygenase YgiN